LKSTNLDRDAAALIPKRSTQDWQALDRAHYLHPFTDHAALHGKGTRVIVRAEGVYLYDSDGRQILDGMAGLWCVSLGYGRRELADAAHAQMLELPYYNSFFQSAHPPAIELARRLGAVTPQGLNHVFFTGSGSEANDTVLRAVRHYWAALGQPGRTVIVSRQNAYHGSTVAGASLGGMAPMHAQGGLPIPGIEHIRQPYWYGEGGDQTPAEFGRTAADALEERIVAVGPERVAAFIAEPIQGAGGVIIPPETYWPRIKEIVQRYGILLVVDEVICGFGRTGHWFGSDYYGLRPDLMPIAKGLSSGYLPIGGVMVADRVARVLIEQGGEFHHGFTYSGHPVACAVACRTLDLLREEGLIDRVHDDTGPYLARRWGELGAHPLVGEARSLGLVGALELVRDKSRRTFFERRGAVGTLCRDFAIQSGVVMRAVRDTMIISPPLVSTRAHVDELVEKAQRTLDLTFAEVRRLGWL
jgi:putrescine aminotransferase